MKATPAKVIQLMVLLFAIIFQFSCSKDTDLLADYVISDVQEARLFANLAIDDYFVVAKDSEIVLDVLSNDSYENPEKVKIVNVSQPENGTVSVNEDKTLTYIPDSIDTPTETVDTPKESTDTLGDTPEKSENPETNDAPEESAGTEESQAPEVSGTPEETAPAEGEKSTSESFTYTTETLNENQTTETTEATVTVTTDSKSSDVSYQVDYYVTANGTVYNDGRTEATAWNIEKAFKTAKAGDVVAIKAGDYGSKNLIVGNSGIKGNPIRFIGYTNNPGDLVSTNGSTFQYGESLDAKKMPYIKGNSSLEGIGLDNTKNYVEIHNFQITNYWISVISRGTNVVLKNIIATNCGEQNNKSSNTGRGFQIYGDYSGIEDCFILNSNSEGINLKGADNCQIKNTKVYSDNLKNMTGYYILISSGGQGNILENCTVYRDASGDNSGNPHQGHGFIMKDQATNNIVRNCKTYNTGLEVNFSGVYDNTFENIDIYGNYLKSNSQHSACIKIVNGAHDNTFKNINIKDTRYAIAFIDFNDGFVGPNGDRDENQGGNDNKFINLHVNKANNVLLFNSVEVGWDATSKNNEFYDCTFENIKSVAFVTKQTTSGTKFVSCNFKNIPNTMMKELNGSQNTLPTTFENCHFVNVGFPIPK